jgi:MFS superfamily sulfate permease-like transporter
MIRALPRDAMAGLLLAAIGIPEQIATARLAGMPAEAGLLAFVAGAIGFAVFGTNRFLSAGADSTIAAIFAGVLATLAAVGTSEYAALASLLAIMVGVFLVIIALLRAGWIADLLSIPILTGFLAGIAVHVIIGQLPAVLGVPAEQGSLLSRTWELLRHLPNANPIALTIGGFVLMVTLLSERLMPRLPGALLAMAVTALCTTAFHVGDRGIQLLDALPSLAPRLVLPLEQLHALPRLLPLALTVALVCMIQTAAVLRAFPSHPGGPRHVAHDFGGVGAGNIISGLFGGFAVNASPPRTAVVVNAGGQSQIAGVVAVIITLALLLTGGMLLGFVPLAALGGLLIAIGVRLFRLNEMVRILRQGGGEILLVAASAFLVIVLPIETGMVTSIVLALLQSFYGVARPLCTELVRAPGTTVWWPPVAEARGQREPGVLVFASAAPLNFTNVDFIRDRLMQAIQHADEPVRLLIIEASGMIDIDYTGSQRLQQLIAQLRSRGIDVAIARLEAERAQRQAQRTGLSAAFGAGHVFRSVEDAVLALRHRGPMR